MRPISFGQDSTISHICATSSSLSSRGKLNNTMCCNAIAAPHWRRLRRRLLRSGSVELEVLAHLPFADVLPLLKRVLGDRGLVPAELRALHLQQVVNQRLPERLAEEAVLLKGADGIAKRRREHRILRRIRISLDRRRRVKLAAHAIQPRRFVRRHVQVPVGGGVAPPQLPVAICISRSAPKPDERATGLPRPAHPGKGEPVPPG